MPNSREASSMGLLKCRLTSWMEMSCFLLSRLDDMAAFKTVTRVREVGGKGGARSARAGAARKENGRRRRCCCETRGGREPAHRNGCCSHHTTGTALCKKESTRRGPLISDRIGSAKSRARGDSGPPGCSKAPFSPFAFADWQGGGHCVLRGVGVDHRFVCEDGMRSDRQPSVEEFARIREGILRVCELAVSHRLIRFVWWVAFVCWCSRCTIRRSTRPRACARCAAATCCR